MDKTVSISLGGYALTMDEQAYQKLKHYLADIRNSLYGTEGIEEIIIDVETRIAEILKQSLDGRDVVNEPDVDHVIEIMGSPAQYADDSAEEEYQAEGYRTGKKLFRDPDEKFLGGVSSGLAHYFGLDTSWVRIFWAVMLALGILTAGVSTTLVILAYVILWAAIPEAKTTADKLQMRGKPVNFDSIKDFVGSGDGLKENLRDMGNDLRKASEGSGNVLGKIIVGIAKVFLWILVAILVITAVSILIGLISALFGFSVAGFAMWENLHYVFPGAASQILALIFLVLIMLILIGFVVFIAMRLISRRYAPNRYVILGMIGLFFLSLAGIGVIALRTWKQFSIEGELTKRHELTVDSDTLNIASLEAKVGDVTNIRNFWNDSDDWFMIKENELERKIWSNLTVKPAPGDDYILEITYKSHAKDEEQLNDYLKGIKHEHRLTGNTLEVDRFITFPKSQKWRDQNAYATLYVPEGKSIKTQDVYKIIFKSEGEKDYFYNPNGKIYTFDGQFLQCDSCESEEVDSNEEFNIDTDGVHLDWKINGEEGKIRIGTEEKGVIIDGEKGLVRIKGDSTNLVISEEGIDLNGKEAKKIKIEEKVIITNGSDTISIGD